MILTECAVTERLRRDDTVKLHPALFVTPLIHNNNDAAKLKQIYQEYRQTALLAGLPILLCAPTWRLDRPRLHEAGYDGSLIADAVDFMRGLHNDEQDSRSPLFVGGFIGPKNDCYTPSQALSADEADRFHDWQIARLVDSDVDCIVTQTIPALSEGLGIARALSRHRVPAIISFVINRQGQILDTTPLAEAVTTIDDQVEHPPLGYMVNCAYPTFICAEKQPSELFRRFIGIQANGSSLDHSQLDGSGSLQQADINHWGSNMLRLNREFGVKILGGCCGTDNNHLQYLTGHTKQQATIS